VKHALTIALGMTLLAAPLASGQSPRKNEDSISAEQRKLQQTERQLREERKKAADARARESSVLAELDVIEKRLGEKRREISRLDVRMKRAAGEAQSLRGEVRQLEAQRAGQQAALARRLRAMYKVHVQGGALPLLLAGDDPTTRAAAIRHLAIKARLHNTLFIACHRVSRQRNHWDCRGSLIRPNLLEHIPSRHLRHG
jgi:septal ring factor EnvC (AmiA/AmiB activator)